MRSMRAAALGVALTMAAGGAAAQDGGADPGLGRSEYLALCAQCHGLQGEGDGIIAQYLTTQPPDLTAIQARNGGVFPFQDIYDVIIGGAETGPHGTREMPAWGNRYAAEAPWVLGWQHTAEERDAFIRSRVLALVAYLATIQTD